MWYCVRLENTGKEVADASGQEAWSASVRMVGENVTLQLGLDR
jgi:hypothetical protein